MTYQEIEQAILKAIVANAPHVGGSATGSDVLTLCECLPLLREHFRERPVTLNYTARSITGSAKEDDIRELRRLIAEAEKRDGSA